MITRLLSVKGDPREDPAVREAASLLRRGELVAFPTETVYGLGADAGNEDAVAKIFEAKNRPPDNPLIVHLADWEDVYRYCHEPDERLEALARAFWPGPLTLVLRAGSELRGTVCRGLETLAVRVPDHPVALALMREAGIALAAPSANLSGRPSPTKAAHVLHDLDGHIPLILDGGPCRVGIESTVLDLTGERPVVLRPGNVTAEDLERVCGTVCHHVSEAEMRKRSPGIRYRHYSPEAEIILLAPAVGPAAFQDLLRFLLAIGVERVGYIGERPLSLPSGWTSRVHHQVESPATLAVHLYDRLRSMDEVGVTTIVIDGLEETGLGVSIMDRLEKAAGTYVRTERELADFFQTHESLTMHPA